MTMTHRAETAVYNWQRKGWPNFTFDRAALGDELVSFAAAFACVLTVGEPLSDPINDPINDPIKDREGESRRESLHEAVAGAIRATPGLNREQLAVRVGKSEATVKRAVAALVKAGLVEHRGSKKTGGYYAREGET